MSSSTLGLLMELPYDMELPWDMLLLELLSDKVY